MKEQSGATRAKNVLQGEITRCDSKATQHNKVKQQGQMEKE
jgi:hypothetical protein